MNEGSASAQLWKNLMVAAVAYVRAMDRREYALNAGEENRPAYELEAANVTLDACAKELLSSARPIPPAGEK